MSGLVKSEALLKITHNCVIILVTASYWTFPRTNDARSAAYAPPRDPSLTCCLELGNI
jgi:hypothetical protein